MKSLAAVAAAMFVFELATVWQVFGAVELRLTNNGGLTFDGGRLSVSAFRVGWTGYYPVKVDWTGHLSGDCKFRICGNAVKIFDGKDSWTMQDDGTVKGVVSLTCVAPAEVQCLALQADIPAVPPFGLGDDTAQDYELPGLCLVSHERRLDQHLRDRRVQRFFLYYLVHGLLLEKL